MAVKERFEVYKCEGGCGNIVEVLVAKGGELVCCGKPMVLKVPNTVDASKERHVPVVEKVSDGVKIKVGSVPHPMEEKHYIQWIEAIVGDKLFREFLKPGMVPEAIFPIKEDQFIAREYCNLHGLWKA